MLAFCLNPRVDNDSFIDIATRNMDALLISLGTLQLSLNWHFLCLHGLLPLSPCIIAPSPCFGSSIHPISPPTAWTWSLCILCLYVLLNTTLLLFCWGILHLCQELANFVKGYIVGLWTTRFLLHLQLLNKMNRCGCVPIKLI